MIGCGFDVGWHSCGVAAVWRSGAAGVATFGCGVAANSRAAVGQLYGCGMVVVWLVA